MNVADYKLKFQRNGPFVFIDKIAGLNTHAPDPLKPGVVELLQSQLKQKLFVVSRLDKGTSGALILATTSESAHGLTQLFESRQVKKKYLFLTDHSPEKHVFEQKSYIFKDGSNFVSDRTHSQPNSHTQFQFLKTLGNYSLWEARPLTGKPHQIRLHAKAAGIPVLGDLEHGGKNFYRMCLHATEVDFVYNGENFHFKSHDPVWMTESSEEDLKLWESLRRRELLFDDPLSANICLRWSHQEIPEYRVDQFGSHLWVYWYKKDPPQAADWKRFERLKTQLGKDIWIRQMVNRGAKGEKSQLWSIGAPHDQWKAEENGVQYELRAQQGLSPGLFLDQRLNRIFIKSHSHEKKVLNLFCYTGGFSINAALGGALETCSVDVSATYLGWTKENFRLNGLSPEDPQYQFWEADSQFFLKACFKRGRKFDLIICDPPSVGRTKEGTFQIQKHLSPLVEACLQVLNPKGEILLSTNYERWGLEDLKEQVLPLCSRADVEVLPSFQAGLDFELPGEAPLMKSLLLKRR